MCDEQELKPTSGHPSKNFRICKKLLKIMHIREYLSKMLMILFQMAIAD